MEIDSAFYMCTDIAAHQHLIGYSLMEADPLKQTASLTALCTKIHLRTITQKHTGPVSLLSNGAGPLRMTTRLLRISGHYPQASGPWGRPAAHTLCLSPNIRQKQVHTSSSSSTATLYLLTLFIEPPFFFVSFSREESQI